MRIIHYTKEAILARERYALKKEQENDTISLFQLKKRLCLQKKKAVKQIAIEKMESHLFSQSIIGMSFYEYLEEEN